MKIHILIATAMLLAAALCSGCKNTSDQALFRAEREGAANCRTVFTIENSINSGSARPVSAKRRLPEIIFKKEILCFSPIYLITGGGRGPKPIIPLQ